MPSSTSSSSSKYISLLVFALVLFGLLITWELVIRAYYNPPVAITYDNHTNATDTNRESNKEWLIFGNCLALNAISPKAIKSFWKRNTSIQDLPWMSNISRHEQSPLAFFYYLKQANHYPDVIITNISSWLNSSNYLMDAQQLIQEDPLALFPNKDKKNTFSLDNKQLTQTNNFQSNMEKSIGASVSNIMKQSDKKFHLLDYTIFLYHLLSTGDLRDSLYQLNIQSWYRMVGQNSDGHGQVAFQINYDQSWDKGQSVMVNKQLVRMRAGNFLTNAYWNELKSYIQHFKQMGTTVYLVRLPEHKDIYRFNESYYKISDRLNHLRLSTKTPILDINNSDIIKKIKLYDTVHPDYESSMLISKDIAAWLSSKLNLQISKTMH